MPDTIERFSVNDIPPRAGERTFGIAFAAAAKATIKLAKQVAGVDKDDSDIPPAMDVEEGNAVAPKSSEIGVAPYFTALMIAAVLLFVWTGLCAIRTISF